MRIQRRAGGELCALASTSPGNNYPRPLLLELWLIFETVGGPTRLGRRALNEWQDLGLSRGGKGKRKGHKTFERVRGRPDVFAAHLKNSPSEDTAGV
jgi:hypothetical protein